MTIPVDGDLIDVLQAQHQQIKAALGRVAVAAGSARADAFAELRSLLHAHELGEQAVVHPATRDFAGEGDIAAALGSEEQQGDEMLAELSEIEPADPAFETRFAALREAVLAHAEHEETEEFPALRAALTAEQLRTLAAKLVTADAQTG